MRGSHRTRGNEERDSGVSPVIAVILMVAITVVLAATVYVWVSGFTDTGDQAPSASLRFVSCTVDDDAVNAKMTAGGPVQMDDVRAIIYNVSADDQQEATSDPLVAANQGYDNQWDTGEQVTIDDSSATADPPNWDGAWTSSGGMGEGYEYSMDLIHKPTESTFTTLSFTC